MSTYATIDPAKFIDLTNRSPEHGRGAWTKAGMGPGATTSSYHGRAGTKVGDQAELGLAEWAVSAGVYAIQERLEALGFLVGLPADKSGIYTRKVRKAVEAFQESQKITPSGMVGVTTARLLWKPVVVSHEQRCGIPDRWLTGIVNQESAFDPGAVGWFIFYDAELRYGGVDRGMCQVNSKANPQVSWDDAFRPWFALRWSADRLRRSFDDLTRDFSDRPLEMRWEAAVCAHNSPANARDWLEAGAPNQAGATYVDAVRKARLT